MRLRRAPLTAIVVSLVAGSLLAACSSNPSASKAHDSVSSTTTTAPTTTTEQPTTTTRARSVTTTTTRVPPSTSRPAPTAPPATAAPPPPPTTTPLLVDRLVGVDGARQVVSVVASGYGATTATMTAYQESGSGWTEVFGPWLINVGYNGFAPPGEKVEGDGRTPTGSYPFGFMFGVDPDPGVQFPWRSISGSDVWNDDPASAYYNQWIDEAAQGTQAAGAGPEPMDDPPFYDYGAVIDYNMDPVSHTPPDGSAIFFHYSPGPTVGCVALPSIGELIDVLKWLNPADAPRIIMGTASSVVS